MRKATHPSSGMSSTNPRHWRGERLHHHGDGVCHVVCAFCAVSDSWIVSRTHRTYIVEVSHTMGEEEQLPAKRLYAQGNADTDNDNMQDNQEGGKGQ